MSSIAAIRGVAPADKRRAGRAGSSALSREGCRAGDDLNLDPAKRGAVRDSKFVCDNRTHPPARLTRPVFFLPAG